LSVRLALGASRWRLARLFLMESVVLAAAGTGLGVVFGAWASRALVAQLSSADSPIVLDLSLDGRVLAFTTTTMVATAILFGLAPALRATRVAPIDALKEHGPAFARGASAGRRRPHSGFVDFAGGLVVAVAVSLMLVVAASLFVERSSGSGACPSASIAIACSRSVCSDHPRGRPQPVLPSAGPRGGGGARRGSGRWLAQSPSPSSMQAKASRYQALRPANADTTSQFV
jgi:hypothetical protein